MPRKFWIVFEPTDKPQGIDHGQHTIAESGFRGVAGVEIVAISETREIVDDRVGGLRFGKRPANKRCLFVFVQQPRMRRAPGFEGVLRQQPESEPVDGGDERGIELERILKTSGIDKLGPDTTLQFSSRRLRECYRDDSIGLYHAVRDPPSE